jgi:hypothetical protein
MDTVLDETTEGRPPTNADTEDEFVMVVPAGTAAWAAAGDNRNRNEKNRMSAAAVREERAAAEAANAGTPGETPLLRPFR